MKSLGWIDMYDWFGYEELRYWANLPRENETTPTGLAHMEKRYDGVSALSTVSGLSKSEVQDIWNEVKANRVKLENCKLHKFSGEVVKLGQKMTCECCKGQMSLTDIGWYIKGYEASGKSCNDIWPGFRR